MDAFHVVQYDLTMESDSERLVFTCRRMFEQWKEVLEICGVRKRRRNTDIKCFSELLHTCSTKLYVDTYERNTR
jgi:hypothetical protein